MENVRVRFAPSPTGPLHMGGVRTALFNYLFAKKHGGEFILRIEDTDQTRYVANAEQYIIDSLEWCGLTIDEGPGINKKYGPYRQSERKKIYQKYIKNLIDVGKAYYAFDTANELDVLRKNAEASKTVFSYNSTTRKSLQNSLVLDEATVASKLENGEKYVVRFNTPENETIYLQDEIRGEIKIDTNTLDDKILFKSDGMPTYHLANIVDDHLMKITHVIRGEEWLPSMPLHVLLYDAFGWSVPKFAHLPLILKPVGKGKLSKRDGDKLGFPVFPLNYTNEETGEVSKGYKEEGYFADAFVNMLAFLGWNPGTEQEIFSLEELSSAFSLERVSKAGAKFSKEKTEWFNQQYIQQKTAEELLPYFKALYGVKVTQEDAFLIQVIDAVKERAVFVKDLWDLASFYFETPAEYDTKASKKQWKEGTPELMTTVAQKIESIENFKSKEIETIVKGWITENELGFGKVMPPLRLAIVGAMKGPDLFEIIEMIGKEETLKRIQKAVNTL